MHPAGDQQAVDAGAVSPGDVGAQAVADRQQALAVGDPEQVDAAVVDRRMRLAVPAHPAADRLVLLGQRPGAERRTAVVDHDEIGVGAYHRQVAPARRLQHRRVILDRVFPSGGAGIEDEIGLLRRLDKIQIQAVAHFQVPVGADMQTMPAEPGVERIVAPVEVLPRLLTRRHDAVIEAFGDADLGDTALDVIGATGCVRQQHQPLAAAEQLFHAVENSWKRRAAVMNDAPQIQNEPIVGRREEPHSVDRSYRHMTPIMVRFA